MTIDDLRRTQLTRSALSDHDEQLVHVLCLLYQCLGDTYHRSEAYQRMVVLYPALAAAIARCDQDSLIPADTERRVLRPLGPRATPLLWERSHGEH
jgi:hypothetical protein